MLSYMKSFMAKLLTMKESDTLTDVRLILSDNSIVKCHKLVLMAASPFFEKCLQSGLKENIEDEVRLEFTDADTMRLLIRFFYSGEIEITVDNAADVATASDFFFLKDLKDRCDEVMSQHVDASNCLRVYTFGKRYELAELSQRALKFIVKDFKEIVKSNSDFDKLPEAGIVQIVSSDNLGVENDDVVFDAVIRWVNADLEGRKKAFEKIVPLIRFPFCSSRMLSIASRNTLMWNDECMELIDEAHQYQSNNHHHLHNQRTIPRRTFKGKKPHLVRLYDTRQGGVRRKCHYAEWMDGKTLMWNEIMCEGGFVNNICISPTGFYWFSDEQGGFSLEVPRGRPVKTSFRRPSCRYSRCFFSNGKIFIFGGFEESLTSVQSLNVNDSQPEWKSEAPMPHPLQDPSVSTFGNKLYIFDGKSSRKALEYDPAWNEWKVLREMPEKSQFEATVAMNEKIYIVGGTPGVCMSYTPATDAWNTHTPPTHAYFECDATGIDGKILLLGQKKAEEYDPARDSWTSKDSLVPQDTTERSSIRICTFLF